MSKLRRMEFKALPEVLKALIPRMTAVARGLFNSYGRDRLRAHEPEDLVNNTFEDVLEKGGSWIPYCESAAQFIGTLFRRMKQLFENMCRRAYNRDDRLNEHLRIVSTDPLSVIFIREDMTSAWKQARGYLSGRARQVGDLLFAGLDKKEIGERLGLSAIQVATPLSHVRRAIRERMGPTFAW